MKHDKDFQRYMAHVHERMEMGEREYGDVGFNRPILELLAEIREELADVSGWAFVAWTRIKAMAAAYEREEIREELRADLNSWEQTTDKEE